MSLFCSYDWWSTKCEERIKEKPETVQGREIDFHSGSLHVADLIQSGLQIVLVGNHSGTLWAFRPTSFNSPQDLLLEHNFGKPILALESGNLLLGSSEKHLAVLHPKKVNIYSLHESFGNAAHGQQFHLEPVYSIIFQFMAYNLVIGSFGSGVNNSAEKQEKDKNTWSKNTQDSVCVQAMDGSLHFFENDINLLCVSSKNVFKGALPLKQEKSHKDLKANSITEKVGNFNFYNPIKSENMGDVTRAEVHDCPSDDFNVFSRSKNLNSMKMELNRVKCLQLNAPKEIEEEGKVENNLQQLDSEDKVGDDNEVPIQLSKPKFTFPPFEDTILPTLLCYMSSEDSFVISSGSWTIDCYRYTTLVLQQIGSRRKKFILPEWSYVLGEPIFSLSYLEGCIFALGTRGTLVSLNQFGVTRFCKKLCFCPSASCPFTKDGKVLLLIASDVGTLMIYDGGPISSSRTDSHSYPMPSASSLYTASLVWSAKLPFTPVAIARASFEELSGLIIILSSDGHLQCCHLGTTPKNFTLMPMARMSENKEEKEIEDKLAQQAINHTGFHPLATSNDAMELALELVINSVKLLPNNEGTSKMCNEGNVEGERIHSWLSSAEVDISLILVPMVPLNNVCLSATVDSPLVASFGNNFIERLYEEVKIPLLVSACYNDSIHEDALPNLCVEVVVSCFGGCPGTTDGLSLMVFQTCTMLPLTAVFSQYQYHNMEGTEGTNDPSIECKKFEFAFHGYNGPTLKFLFSEFNFPPSDSKSSCLDLFLFGHGLKRVQLTRECKEESSEAAAMDCMYSISCSSIIPLYSLACKLAQRLENHVFELGSHISGNGSRQKGCFFQVTPRTPLPLADLLEAVDAHSLARQKVIQLHYDLGCLSSQLHMAECCILSRVKDTTPKPIIFSEALLEPFSEKIYNGIKALQESQQDLNFNVIKLRTLIQLVVQLQPEVPSNPLFKFFGSAISIALEDFMHQGWEERTEASLAYVLRGQRKSSLHHFSANATYPMLTAQNTFDIHSLKNEIIEFLEKSTNSSRSERAIKILRKEQ